MIVALDAIKMVSFTPPTDVLRAGSRAIVQDPNRHYSLLSTLFSLCQSTT